eukprot:TRINITY_DN78949_c0_g1_i1.p1 TRINITY_DN78949_c0_g1~~TRINITY_DN78949_c0_g1_i1.p1  ORF type:complete len:185 (-),score=4.86 TRINITY_DN78949_c0_g1_i1:105-659(-)
MADAEQLTMESPPSPTTVPQFHFPIEEKEVHSRTELIDLLVSKRTSYRAVFLLFLANHDPATGASWCPDCRRAEPVISRAVRKISSPPSDPQGPATSMDSLPALLVHVWAGDRPTWKSPNNEFRGPPFVVQGVPTLLHWEWDSEEATTEVDQGEQRVGSPGKLLGDKASSREKLVIELFSIASS